MEQKAGLIIFTKKNHATIRNKSTNANNIELVY